MWGCQEGHFPFCRLEVRVTYSLTCRSLGIFLRANGSHLLRTPSSGKWHIVLYVPFSKIADSHLPNQRPWGNSEETLVGQRYSMLSLAYEEPYAQRGRSGDSFSSIFCYLPKEAPPAKSNDGGISRHAHGYHNMGSNFSNAFPGQSVDRVIPKKHRMYLYLTSKFQRSNPEDSNLTSYHQHRPDGLFMYSVFFSGNQGLSENSA